MGNWGGNFEPLDVIAKDDPVTCAVYAKEHGLLDTPGWKQFKRIAKRSKRLIRMVRQAKLKQVRRTPIYKYGYRVPRSHQEAIEIDTLNGNTKWQDAEKLELDMVLKEYKTFIDLGKAQFDTKGKVINGPKGYQKIRVHMVYDVKHDGRHKARLVADGHLTDIPLEAVYSGVVTLKSLRITIFLGELNGMPAWGGDIGNAYLEAITREKVFIIAGPEFGELQGHILIVHKALYGLKLSGKMWHERLADSFRELGFTPSKADSDVWMRPAKDGSCYEYVAVYVDDLAFAVQKPEEFVKQLTDQCKFKLKGVGPLSYHLGANYTRDEDGTLVMSPTKYVEKMMSQYQVLFGTQPKKYWSPLEPNDHPELDNSELCNQEEITKYQSLIGALQWAISLGKFDIFTAVMTLSRFRVAPRKGHIERAQRIYGYVLNTKDSAIRFRTGEPDYSALPELLYTWTRSVYGDVQEIVPKDAPRPRGKPVVLTSYVDANLMHDMVTGRSVTAVLHLANKTPFDWYCKRQSTVETATYGSEFSAARTAIDQIIEHRLMLRYLGVPITGKTYLFGDNKSVVTSSTVPHSVLSKRHLALSYHRVREAVASGIVVFYHIDGKKNPADILSKHWAYNDIKNVLLPLLYWKGDTLKYGTTDDGEKREDQKDEST